MSRIGKVPIDIPKNVRVTIDQANVLVDGPKGKLSMKTPKGVAIENKENKVFVTRVLEGKQSRANFGTTRALIANMIQGTAEGYKRNLEVKGVGFRAQIQGKKLVISLGFSHPVEFTVPENISIKVPKPTEIEVEGIDKAVVGEIAAQIRRLKKPEPYKGKGIRYAGEIVRRKQGKSVTK